MKHIFSRTQYINENLEDLGDIGDLDFLKDIGLVNPSEYALVTKKLGINQKIIERVLASDQMARLRQLGFVLDSGQQQLKNGTIVFKIPGKSKRLGIFPNGVVRRMHLNTADLALAGGRGGIDSKIKTFDGAGVEMYLQAMDWIIDEIDTDDNELLTKRVVASQETARVKKLELIEKIRAEFRKLGFDESEIDDITDNVRPWSVADAKSYLSIIKKWVKQGIFPFFGYFSFSYRDEKTAVTNRLLSKPGIRWIKMNNQTTLSVFLNSVEIWDNFDLAAQIKLVSWDHLTIKFEKESQVEEYREIFNNYEPINGVKIVPKVMPQGSPGSWMFS
jgi:hypothetical protein